MHARAIPRQKQASERCRGQLAQPRVFLSGRKIWTPPLAAAQLPALNVRGAASPSARRAWQ
eukprot:5928208-Pyramimonas_sp.AAC.1